MVGQRAIQGTSQAYLAILLLLLHSLRQGQALYHTSSEVLHWFSHSAAKHPSVLRFREVKEHHSRTAVPVAEITSGADAAHTSRSKPVVLFVFGEHAREVITSEVGLWLARMLVDDTSAVYSWPELGEAFARANSSKFSSGGNGDWAATAKAWVQEVLQKLEVQIVPIESMDSRRQVEEGQLCVRKTSHNVDLNRNWPFAWRRENPWDEQYGGLAPLSEPQSRLMKQIVDESGQRLLGYVNVHSGEWALYTPWDSKPAYGSGMPADMPELVATMGRVCNCKAGPAGAVSGYLAYGSSMDYLYVHKKVPYPLTVEVYGGGDVGKLMPGETNKPVNEFETIERPAPGQSAEAPVQGRRSLRQQQEQQRKQRHTWQGQELQEQEQEQQLEYNAVGSEHLQQQQQQQQPPGWSAGGRVEHRSSRRLLLDVSGSRSSGGALQVYTQASSNTRKLAEFLHGHSLRQLRQQALLQLTQQQLSQPAAAAPDSSQQQDAILTLVATASKDMRACFEAFNPPTETEYRRVVADWLAAFVIMLKHMSEGEGMTSIQAAAGAAAAGDTGGATGGTIEGGSWAKHIGGTVLHGEG